MFLIFINYQNSFSCQTATFDFYYFMYTNNFNILLISNLFFVASIFVITSYSMIHSIFSLIILFLLSTVFLFVVGADFIAFLLLIVYVGAIAVLFIFIIIMVNFYSVHLKFYIVNVLFNIICLSLFHFITMEVILQFYIFVSSNDLITFMNSGSSSLESFLHQSILIISDDCVCTKSLKFLNLSILEEIGFFFNSFFVMVFLLCGIILMLGIVGVILLIKVFFENKKKQQYINDQILKSFNTLILSK